MRLALLAALTLCAAFGPLSPADAQPQVQTHAPKLAFPVACEIGRSCEIQHYVDRDPGPAILDYRCGHRAEDKHDGIDFRLLDMAAQRAGVLCPSRSARPGGVAVRDGVPDISVHAPGAPSVAGHQCGNRVGIGLGDGWILDYCHLAQGSLKVKVGDAVTVGQPLAHVGLSGDTEFPHVHFSVRHNNLVVDPFAPAAATGCEPEAASLWTAAAASQMAYKRGVVLQHRFLGRRWSTTRRSRTAPRALPVVAPRRDWITYARLIEAHGGG